MVRRSRRGSRKTGRGIRRSRPRPSFQRITRTVCSYGKAVVSQNYARVDITYKDILAYGPNAALKIQFRQVRVVRVDVLWTSDSATSDSGSIALVVEDWGQNSSSDKTPFEELAMYPGGQVRRCWQLMRSRWLPSEPAERNWRDVASGDGLLTVTVKHSVSAGKISGNILLRVHVQLRGVSIDRCKTAATLLEAYEETLQSPSHMQD